MLRFRDMLNVEYFTRNVPLVIGTVLVVASSHFEVFSNYVDALKAMFNLTQSEVEWLSTAKIVAAISSIPADLVHHSKGATVSLLAGMVTWSAGVILLGWSVYMSSVVDIPFTLLLIGITLWAHGRTYFMITGMVTLVHNVSLHHRPVVSAYVELLLSSGTLLYVLIYTNFFHNGHVVDPQNQNLLGFFVMQLCVAVCVSVISIFGLTGCSNKSYTQSFVECEQHSKSNSQYDPKTKIEENILTEDSTVPTSNISDYGSTTAEMCNDLGNLLKDDANEFTSDFALENGDTDTNTRKTLWSIMFGMQFLLYNVTMTIVSAGTTFFSLHVSILARILGFSLQETSLITIYRAMAVVGLLSGLLLMLFSKKHYLPFWLLQIGCLLSLSGYLSMLFAPTQVWALYFSAVAQGMSYGLIMSMFPGIVENFSSKHLGMLFGIVSTSFAVLLLIIQPIFGVLYRAQIPQYSTSIYCYGPACLIITIWMLVSLAVISNCVCLALVISKHR